MQENELRIPDFASEKERERYILAQWEEAEKHRKRWKKKLYYREEEEAYLVWHGGIPMLQFHSYDEFSWVKAAFSTRFGGLSKGYLGELNLGFSRGDHPETVGENFRRFCRSLGVAPEGLVLSHQVHETKVRRVFSKDACQDTICQKFVGVDGLCTDEKGLTLATSYADCVPIYLVDPVHRAIASSHSGWRGTVAQMAAETVVKMEKEFGSSRKDLVAVVGPSICQHCYEVSEDVAGAFQAVYSEEELSQILMEGKEAGKYQLDLWAAIYYTLIKAGLLAEHIHVTAICTCCHPQFFYSHRASGGKRGNLNAFLSLLPDRDE